MFVNTISNVLYFIHYLFSDSHIYTLEITNTECIDCIDMIKSSIHEVRGTEVISYNFERNQVMVLSSQHIKIILDVLSCDDIQAALI